MSKQRFKRGDFCWLQNVTEDDWFPVEVIKKCKKHGLYKVKWFVDRVLYKEKVSDCLLHRSKKAANKIDIEPKKKG